MGRTGRNLFILAALAVIGAAIVAAAASASSVISTGSNGVTVNLPNGQSLPPIGSLPACSNGRDDDGDGLVDLADPDCSGPLDPTESARRNMRPKLRTRFYQAATVGEGAESVPVLLDGRPVRTPARALLAAPVRSSPPTRTVATSLTVRGTPARVPITA